MNECLFIYLYRFKYKILMARQIDEDKIKRIKEATMQTIVENGIESTTIAMIAKKAEVSGGYLYRIYKGKQDLISELYFEKVHSIYNELISLLEVNQTSIKPLIKSFVQNRIVYFINEPIASQFYYQLLHNENFVLTEELKTKSLQAFEQIKSIGVASSQISSSVTLYQLYYHLFIYTIDYINIKRKNIFGISESTDNDITLITENILKILK